MPKMSNQDPYLEKYMNRLHNRSRYIEEKQALESSSKVETPTESPINTIGSSKSIHIPNGLNNKDPKRIIYHQVLQSIKNKNIVELKNLVDNPLFDLSLDDYQLLKLAAQSNDPDIFNLFLNHGGTKFLENYLNDIPKAINALEPPFSSSGFKIIIKEMIGSAIEHLILEENRKIVNQVPEKERAKSKILTPEVFDDPKTYFRVIPRDLRDLMIDELKGSSIYNMQKLVFGEKVNNYMLDWSINRKPISSKEGPTVNLVYVGDNEDHEDINLSEKDLETIVFSGPILVVLNSIGGYYYYVLIKPDRSMAGTAAGERFGASAEIVPTEGSRFGVLAEIVPTEESRFGASAEIVPTEGSRFGASAENVPTEGSRPNKGRKLGISLGHLLETIYLNHVKDQNGGKMPSAIPDYVISLSHHVVFEGLHEDPYGIYHLLLGS